MGYSEEQIKERLKELSELIKNGGDYTDYIEEMDRLLGTQLEARNRDAEAIFEESKVPNE